MPWWLSAALVAALLLEPDAPVRLRRLTRPLWWGLVAATCLGFAVGAGRMLARNSQNPPEWDFRAFWLWSRAAALGLDFYEPESLRPLAEELKPSASFEREVVDVGFVYPPPSMFLFLPLGWLDLRAAYGVWATANSLALLAAVWLLWRTFAPELGTRGLGLMATLLVALGPTLWTLRVAQTHFLLLLALLASRRKQEGPAGGAWLGVAIIIKPLAALLLLPPAARRQWKVLGGALATLGLSALASLLAFGTGPFLSWSRQSPSVRLPAWVYTQPVNQSLLATVLRAGYGDAASASFPLVFWGMLAVLTITTVALASRLRGDEAALAFPLGLTYALLIYPGTLAHYAVLLVIPLGSLWMQRAELPGSSLGPTLLAAVTAGLLSRVGWGVFVAIALTWSVLVAVAASCLLRPAGRQLVPHAGATAEPGA